VLAGVLVAENVWLLARSSGESKTASTTDRTVEKEPGKESTGTPTPASGSSSSVAPITGTIATPQEQPKPKKTIYLRDDFKSRVLGKSAAEVLDAVGRPDSTQENNVIYCWYYDGVTKDPVSNKVDHYVAVSFDKKGKVESVNFY
jgi:hypothetical protein